MMYDIAVVIMIGVFSIYFYFITKSFGVLDSISLSFYKLEEQKRNRGWWFLAFAWGLGFPMVVFLEFSGLFMIPIFCVLLLGAAPQYKRKMTETVHLIGALGSLGSALILIGIVFGNWWCIGGVLAAIGLLRIFKTRNLTTWEETVAFIGTCVGLLIR